MSSGFDVKRLFYFDTIKFVTVHSVPLGATHRSIQLIVLLYIFIYSVWINKGYQEYSQVSGVLYSKAKGLGFTNGTNGLTILDSSDLVYPPVENDAMFITTAFVNTPQQQGTCDSILNCTQDSDCKPAMTSTGEILNQCNTTSGFCVSKGWCPLEVDSSATTQIVQNVEQITIFLRTSAKYDSFNIIVSDSDSAILGRNLFSVKDILSGAGLYIQNCSAGCIVSIGIDWTCDLDHMGCIPKFSFQSTPGGFNYRKIDYDITHTERYLEKLYGLRFLVKITGQGGKFSFFRVMLTIGSGAAFFTIATVITDFILLFVFSSQQTFETQKWEHYRLNNEAQEKEDQDVPYTNSDE